MLEIQGNRLPARAALRPDGMYLALRDIGPEELRDAFMQETIVRIPASETIVHVAREDIGKAAPDTAPAGLIFHVARCGSTLISQLLRQHDQVRLVALAVDHHIALAVGGERVERRGRGGVQLHC